MSCYSKKTVANAIATPRTGFLALVNERQQAECCERKAAHISFRFTT